MQFLSALKDGVPLHKSDGSDLSVECRGVCGISPGGNIRNRRCDKRAERENERFRFGAMRGSWRNGILMRGDLWREGD